jgi:colicin import membrane protein
MRPAEVDKEAIIEAGQALQAAGRNITGFALRQKVGGGNPSRLVQIWKEHVSNQTEAQAEPVAELPVEVAEVVAGVSKELTDRLAALAVELNDKAVKASERRVAEVVRAAGEQREQAERELADAAVTVEDLETKLDTSEEQARELGAKLAQVQGEHQAQAVELAQVRERLVQIEQASRLFAEQSAAMLERVSQERDQARADLDQVRGQLASVKARAESADQAHQEAQAQANAELARSRQEADQARAELGTIRADLDQVRGQLASVKARAESADSAHQEQRKKAAAEAHRHAERLTKAQGERDAARKEANQAREDAAKLRGQVEALQAQTGDLTRALATVQTAKSASAEGASSPDASTQRGGRSKRGG